MRKLLFRTTIAIALFAIASVSSPATTRDEDDYRFESERRVNAHGDEFMALDQTADGRFLIVGTESGKLIIWSIAERRIVKQLDQSSAVHCVVALNDADTFVAAGGPHVGPTNRAVIRKWHINTGDSEEWKGLTGGSIMSLAYEPKSELIAADTLTGNLAVWNAANGVLVTKRSFASSASGLTIDGKEIYRTEMSLDEDEDVKPNSVWRFRIDQPDRLPVQVTKDKDAVWGALELSPDRRFLAARLYKDSTLTTVVLELATAKRLAALKRRISRGQQTEVSCFSIMKSRQRGSRSMLKLVQRALSC